MSKTITPTKVEYDKVVQTKFGDRYKYLITYEGKRADFLSNTQEQNKFKEGVQVEVNETSREYNGVTYFSVRPVKQGQHTSYSRQKKQEQARYSGFAMSYAKDLVVAGKLDFDKMLAGADKMLRWMVEADKKIENDNL